MRRVRQCVDQAVLPVYEWIMELYGPYVLIRCARYTNRRRHSQQIGAYVLICTCLLSREVEHLGQLGRLIDIMVAVVGPDVVSGGQREVWCGGCDELLIVDQRMRKMAAALNSLKRPWREVLVLHYVTGVEPDDLARLWQEPAAAVTAKIGRAERLLAKRLEGLYGKGDQASAPDVRSLLTQFAAALDAGWMQEVADCALDYLAAPAGRPRRRHRCRDWD